MLYAGGITGLTVLVPVEISGQWTQLGETVDTLAFDASAAASEMEAASSSWTGLVSSYEEPATQEVVRTAFNQVPEVTRAWSDVMAKAAGVLQGFATEAAGLEARASDLHADAVQLRASLWISGLVSGLAGDLTAEDEQLQRKILRHNNDVLALNSQWEQLEQQTAERLDSLAGGGGLEEDVPEVTAEGGVYSLTAGGSSASGDGDGDGLLSAALVQLIGSGAEPDEDPVDEATELYEKVTSDAVTGDDVKAFYEQLENLDADQIEEFAEENPKINQYSMPLPANQEQLDSWPTGEDGASWWETMGDNETQNAMLAHLPLLTGNTEGVRYNVRAAANSNALERLRASDDLAQNQRERLDAIAGSLDEDGHDGERLLLSLNMGQDPTTPGPAIGPPPADPLAAVSVGNPDAADTTSFDVSGMKSGTHNMPDEVSNAQTLYDDQAENSSQEHAVVSWIGYDSPGYGTVAFDGKADDGSWGLAYALDGYQHTMDANHPDGDTRVNVNAHSYGTATAAYALTRTSHNVDTFTMYGSAGIPEDAAKHASDLNVARTDQGRPAVYATDASQDEVSDLGRDISWRTDPTEGAFGAYTFSSEGMGDPPGKPVADHYQQIDTNGEYGYRDSDSQTLEALQRINDGRGDEVDEVTDASAEHYENFFDQNVDLKYTNPAPWNPYSTGYYEYEVTIDGATETVDTRYEAMKMVSEHEAGQEFDPAEQAEVQAEASDQYYESLYDELVTRRMVDDDGGDYSLVPNMEYEVELGDDSHRVETRAEALELIKEYYNEHGLPASGGS